MGLQLYAISYKINTNMRKFASLHSTARPKKNYQSIRIENAKYWEELSKFIHSISINAMYSVRKTSGSINNRDNCIIIASNFPLEHWSKN